MRTWEDYKNHVKSSDSEIYHDMGVSRFFRKFISSASKYRNQIYGFSSSFGCSISILNRCLHVHNTDIPPLKDADAIP